MSKIPTYTAKTAADAKRYADDVVGGRCGYRIQFHHLRPGQRVGSARTCYTVEFGGQNVYLILIDPTNGQTYA